MSSSTRSTLQSAAVDALSSSSSSSSSPPSSSSSSSSSSRRSSLRLRGRLPTAAEIAVPAMAMKQMLLRSRGLTSSTAQRDLATPPQKKLKIDELSPAVGAPPPVTPVQLPLFSSISSTENGDHGSCASTVDWPSVPHSIMGYIMSFLPVGDVRQAAAACRNWKESSFFMRSVSFSHFSSRRYEPAVHRALLRMVFLRRLDLSGMTEIDATHLQQIEFACQDLQTLIIAMTDISSLDMLRFRHLKDLDISMTKIDQEDFQSLLGNVPVLRRLRAMGLAGISCIDTSRCPDLEELDVSLQPSLCSLTVAATGRLKRLNVAGTQVPRFFLVEPGGLLNGPAASGLQWLDASDVEDTDTELPFLYPILTTVLQKCRNLSFFSLADYGGELGPAPDGGFLQLSTLQTLILSRTRVDDGMIHFICTSFPSLVHLDITAAPVVTPAINLNRLETLEFSSCGHLQRLILATPLLAELVLDDLNRLTDDMWFHSYRVSQLPALRSISFVSCNLMQRPFVPGTVKRLEMRHCSSLKAPVFVASCRLDTMIVVACNDMPTDYVSSILHRFTSIRSVLFSSIRKMETFNFVAENLRKMVFHETDHLNSAKLNAMLSACPMLTDLTFSDCFRSPELTLKIPLQLARLEFTVLSRLKELNLVLPSRKAPHFKRDRHHLCQMCSVPSSSLVLNLEHCRSLSSFSAKFEDDVDLQLPALPEDVALDEFHQFTHPTGLKVVPFYSVNIASSGISVEDVQRSMPWLTSRWQSINGSASHWSDGFFRPEKILNPVSLPSL